MKKEIYLIANMVTYTQLDADGALHEITQRLDRRRKLSYAGARRIIRSAGVPAVDVIRIEAMGIAS